MNYLIAKSGRYYHKILSQNTPILDVIDINNIDSVPFTANYHPEEDQWFRIDNFSSKSFYIEQCSNNFSTTSLNQITNQEFDKIRILCIIQNDQKFFQRITPNLYVRQKRFIDVSGTPKIVEHRQQLEITKESDAIYNSSNDALYFKSLSKIKSIFPGIETLNRAATQVEVNDFLGNTFIDLGTYDPNTVGIPNRKRIADIGSKYDNLSQSKKDSLLAYARTDSGLDLNSANNFIIDNELKLRKFLFALDQRFYYSDIYDEKRLANSVIVV